MIPGETVLSQESLGMPKDPHFSDFKVMQSQGTFQWYIGTMYLSCGNSACSECKDYLGEPKPKGHELDYNSRETDYFKTKKEAEDALEEYKKTGVLPGMRY